MRKLVGCVLVAGSLVASGCSGNAITNAYKADVALKAIYQTAAPIRADLCRPPAPILDAKTCDTALKVLTVDYALIGRMTNLLALYEANKDSDTAVQIAAIYPEVIKAITELSGLIGEFKSPSTTVTR